VLDSLPFVSLILLKFLHWHGDHPEAGGVFREYLLRLIVVDDVNLVPNY
jgi:hypothetical protein